MGFASLSPSYKWQRQFPKPAVPAKAGTHQSANDAVEPWIPAFPTDQVRGLKAHGTADLCIRRKTLPIFSRCAPACYKPIDAARRPVMTDTISVIREAERPVVPFVGGATYKAIIGDDTGEGLPIRNGVQTSPSGYQTRGRSPPHVESLPAHPPPREPRLHAE